MSCVETLTLHRRYQLANGKKDSVATFFATPAKIPPGWLTIRARVPVLVPSTTCKYQPVQNQTSFLRQKTTKCFLAETGKATDAVTRAGYPWLYEID